MNNCPYPDKPKTSTRRLVLVLFAALAISACADNDSQPQTDSGSDTATASNTVEPQPPPEKLIEPAREKRRAIELLQDYCNSTEPQHRRDTTEAILDMADRSLADCLLDRIEQEPDDNVRAHIAELIGRLELKEREPLLRELAEGAAPALRVWYDEALCRLGATASCRQLFQSASHKQLETAFAAVLKAAQTSQPGDRKMIRKLLDFLKRVEADHDEQTLPPLADLLVLEQLSDLGHHPARDRLHELVKHENPEIALAAAETLARLGDQAGRTMLEDTLSDGRASDRERTRAALALAEIGEYDGYEYMYECLSGDDPTLRRYCAEGLRYVGSWDSLHALFERYQDPNPRVRIAAATAVLFILGLSPTVLARESIDWVRTMMSSTRWQDREQAALVVSVLPAADAIPLLARGLADPEPRVRLKFAENAAALKHKGTAKLIGDALRLETDDAVRAVEVAQLAAIADPASKEVLEEVAKGEDRPGVLALGALIAVGEASALGRLSALYDRANNALRLAAMEAAILARSLSVIALLQRGLNDRVESIRLKAAEGLARYSQIARGIAHEFTTNTDEAQQRKIVSSHGRVADPEVVSQLRESILTGDVLGQSHAQARALLAQASEQAETAGVALRALLELEPARAADDDTAGTLTALMEAPDPALRETALDPIASMPWARAKPLLLRALRDPEPQVRRAAVDKLGQFTAAQGRDVAPPLKQAIRDLDGITRNRAKAHLARITPKPKNVLAPSPNTGDPSDDGVLASYDLSAVRAAAASVEEQQQAFESALGELDQLATQLAQQANQRARSDDDVSAVEKLGQQVEEAQSQVLSTYSRVTMATAELRRALAASPDIPSDDPAAQELDALRTELGDIEDNARDALADTRAQKQNSQALVARYVEKETAHCDLYVSGAETAIQAGRLMAAQRDLEKARRACGKGNRKPAQLDFVWGFYYDERSQTTTNPRIKRRQLTRAHKHYELFIANGAGYRVERARERVQELTAALAAGDDDSATAPTSSDE
ncbi:MAG: hypothetical protein Tsb0020_22960 [Haliangiales bacterium]